MICRTWLIVSGTLLFCATVPASGGEEHGGTVNPFAGDIGNVIWTVMIFGLVLVVLGKFAWGPILNALQKREDFIHDSLANAKKDREEAQACLKEYTEKIIAARAEATAIVEEGRRDAEVVKRRIEENARAEADRMIERARREISIATETAVMEIYTHSAKLATAAASKVIRRELDPKEHERLIAESINDLESLSQN